MYRSIDLNNNLNSADAKAEEHPSAKNTQVFRNFDWRQKDSITTNEHEEAAALHPRTAVGPFIVDYYCPDKKMVVELLPSYAFYRNTTCLTPQTRWRHKLLRSGGFKLVVIPYRELYCSSCGEA